jgi:hypothetical protein
MAVTKEEFRELFMRALSTAASVIDGNVTAPTSRSFLIELHGAGVSGQLMSVDSALDLLYLGDDRFFRIIDVAIRELRSDASVAFVRVSGHAPSDFSDTVDPAGLGPFKQLVAAHIDDRRLD